MFWVTPISTFCIATFTFIVDELRDFIGGHRCNFGNRRVMGHTTIPPTILWLSGLCPGKPGWADIRRNIHPLTPVVVINHSLSAFSIVYDTWHPPCSIYVLDSLFSQCLFKFSLAYLLAWHPPLHTPYISSPNHCLLFAVHAHTIATCFAVVPKLCHLILVPLSTLYLELYLLV